MVTFEDHAAVDKISTDI